ncbi:DUF3613 domain-containing protein [Variovorax sp. RB2P76]|uniref:DUF3613 domain-containing protein n=1 Tax=unclassified Variovorax TaxID=663243 RepID=UPI003F46B1F0
MNNKFPGLFASLPAGALAAALLVTSASAAAQVSAKVKETDAKPVATAAASADTPKDEAATPGAQASREKEQAGSQQQSAEAEEFDLVPLQVGDATQSLLAWQRSGEIASPSPRTIAGNVASRSYDRYIKSFEFPIPERLGSTVTKSSGSTSGASSSPR